MRRSSADLRTHLSQIVEAQAVALRAGDYSAARRHAARALRSRFSDETFGIMIDRGYPLIAESAEVQVFGARDNGTQAWLTVRFTGQGGRQGWYRYQFVREPGGWKISAVVPIDPPVATVRAEPVRQEAWGADLGENVESTTAALDADRAVWLQAGDARFAVVASTSAFSGLRQK